MEQQWQMCLKSAVCESINVRDALEIWRQLTGAEPWRVEAAIYQHCQPKWNPFWNTKPLCRLRRCEVEAGRGPNDKLWKSAVQRRSARTEALPKSCFGRPARVVEPYSRVWRIPAPRMTSDCNTSVDTDRSCVAVEEQLVRMWLASWGAAHKSAGYVHGCAISASDAAHSRLIY